MFHVCVYLTEGFPIIHERVKDAQAACDMADYLAKTHSQDMEIVVFFEDFKTIYAKMRGALR